MHSKEDSMSNSRTGATRRTRALSLVVIGLVPPPPFTFGGLETAVPVSGLAAPAGVTIASDNLFVLDRGANQVIELPASGVKKGDKR